MPFKKKKRQLLTAQRRESYLEKGEKTKWNSALRNPVFYSQSSPNLRDSTQCVDNLILPCHTLFLPLSPFHYMKIL